MREIKFRGKSTTEFDDKKIWLYGDLLQSHQLLLHTFRQNL